MRSWHLATLTATEEQCNMLDGLLRFDPNGRLTASEALRHPYLEGHHCEEDEIVAPNHIDWSFDDVPQEPGRLQQLVYLEAASMHPDILERDREELEAKGWLTSPDISKALATSEAVAPAAPSAS